MKRFINLTLGVPYQNQEPHVIDTGERIVHLQPGCTTPMRRSELPPEETALARLQPVRQRWFMDRDAVGDEYLVPADRRWEWDAWCIASENTCEVLPVPEWAKRLADQIRWVEFEMPVELSI